MGVEALDRAIQYLLGLARGDERPERPGNFEPQIRTYRKEIGSGRFPLRARGANKGVISPTRIDRPLQVEPCAVVVRHVGIQG